MKKVLIYGCGSTGRRIYDIIKDRVAIVGFVDSDERKWNKNIYDNVLCIGGVESICEKEIDEIIVASLAGYDEICNVLIDAGIGGEKINKSLVETQVKARINFLENFAKMISCRENFMVAEGGVFQGEFAKEINRCFPNTVLHLFDTFEGFDKRDAAIENDSNYSKAMESHLSNTTVEMVIGKCPFKENVVIHKGYFPATAEGLKDITFGFVNLDFDLYKPTMEGLSFFYPRMIDGGVILIHDYYNPEYKGIAEAVAYYEQINNINLIKLPIGDNCSIAIYKN